MLRRWFFFFLFLFCPSLVAVVPADRRNAQCHSLFFLVRRLRTVIFKSALTFIRKHGTTGCPTSGRLTLTFDPPIDTLPQNVTFVSTQRAVCHLLFADESEITQFLWWMHPCFIGCQWTTRPCLLSSDWCISRQLWWGHQIPAYRVEFSHSADKQEVGLCQLHCHVPRRRCRFTLVITLRLVHLCTVYGTVSKRKTNKWFGSWWAIR